MFLGPSLINSKSKTLFEQSHHNLLPSLADSPKFQAIPDLSSRVRHIHLTIICRLLQIFQASVTHPFSAFPSIDPVLFSNVHGGHQSFPSLPQPIP